MIDDNKLFIFVHVHVRVRKYSHFSKVISFIFFTVHQQLNRQHRDEVSNWSTPRRRVGARKSKIFARFRRNTHTKFVLLAREILLAERDLNCFEPYLQYVSTFVPSYQLHIRVQYTYLHDQTTIKPTIGYLRTEVRKYFRTFEDSSKHHVYNTRSPTRTCTRATHTLW